MRLVTNLIVLASLVAVGVSGCTAGDDKMASAIHDAFVAQQKDVADQCEIAAYMYELLDEGSEPHWKWVVTTDDRKREVWTIECVVDHVEITTAGRRSKTEVVYQALFDSTTGSLTFDQRLARALVNWNIFLSNPTLKVNNP
jgi:hypothetical protein